MFFIIGVLKKSHNIHRKSPVLESLFHNKSAVLKAAAFRNFIKKMAPRQTFFCEYCEIFKNIIFTEHSLPVAVRNH